MRQISGTLPWQAVFSNIWAFAEHRIWPYGTSHIDNGSWQHTHPDRTFEPSVWYFRGIYLCFNLFNNFTAEIYFTPDRLPKTHDFCFGFINNHMIIHTECVQSLQLFCIPCWVSENSFKSSARNRWAIISSNTRTPYSRLRYATRSAMHLRNRNPLAIPPWLTPMLFNIGGLSFAFRFTQKLLLSYKLLSAFITRPFHPLLNNL